MENPSKSSISRWDFHSKPWITVKSPWTSGRSSNAAAMNLVPGALRGRALVGWQEPPAHNVLQAGSPVISGTPALWVDIFLPVGHDVLAVVVVWWWWWWNKHSWENICPGLPFQPSVRSQFSSRVCWCSQSNSWVICQACRWQFRLGFKI